MQLHHVKHHAAYVAGLVRGSGGWERRARGDEGGGPPHLSCTCFLSLSLTLAPLLFQNAAAEKYAAAEAKGDLATMLALQPALKFNGGGHINHSLFWQNLCPPGEAGPPEGALAAAIAAEFGSVDALQARLSAAGAGIQGSGWAWLGWDPAGRRLGLGVTANQDPAGSVGLTPLLGIDCWEHSYYLQYKNVRPDYLKAVWKVVNWRDVGVRYEAAVKGAAK
jgi:Fe-Mn family superoxide dismutase